MFSSRNEVFYGEKLNEDALDSSMDEGKVNEKEDFWSTSPERDIGDLKNSLELLDKQKIETFSSSNKNNNSSEASGSVTQLDAEVFDKILSIGSLISLNTFRLDTIKHLNNLPIFSSLKSRSSL